MWQAQVPTVSVDEVKPDAFLLDVREDSEWAAGRAPGAHHVPMQELPVRTGEVPAEAPVVVVCRSGHRSAHVTAFLLANGWSDVANLDGGMIAWQAAGRPIETDGNQPATVI
jgi:rhodanese-related sulfurtransferase